MFLQETWEKRYYRYNSIAKIQSQKFYTSYLRKTEQWRKDHHFQSCFTQENKVLPKKTVEIQLLLKRHLSLSILCFHVKNADEVGHLQFYTGLHI